MEIEIADALIFTKPNCPYCVKAKEILNKKNISFRELEVGKDVEKSDIQELVDTMNIETTIKTVPQIFLIYPSKSSELNYIGGCSELEKHFNV